MFCLGRIRSSIVSTLLSLAFLAGSHCVAVATDRLDRRLLPAKVTYVRDAPCNPVEIHMPVDHHWASDGNLISPRPSAMPLFQGDTAMCFAYSTADMISQRVQVVVSPLDVATKYYFANVARLGASQSLDLQRHLAAMGDYRFRIRQVRAKADVSAVGNPGRLPFIDKLEDGEEDIAALTYNIGGICEDRAFPSYDGFKFHADYLSHLRFQARFLPKPKQCFSILGDAAQGLLSPKTDWFNATWVQHVEQSCHRFPSPVPLLPVTYRIAENEQDFMTMLDEGRRPTRRSIDRMFSMLDYALDHQRAPAIGYSFWVFEERPATDPDVTADHSSVVIGRRKVAGACQYRVQDNTGEYCSRMRGAISARCENGRVWLTKDELRQTLYSVTYLR